VSSYEERVAALEKDAALMKRDIIYKLDDTNSAVTMVRGIVGAQGQDIKYIKNQVKVIDVRLDGIEMRLEGLKEQQDTQSGDSKEIKHHLDRMDRRFNAQDERLSTVDQRLTSLEGKLDQILLMLTTLTNKPTE
jgi:chromosome segregation ATPase